MPRSNNVRVSRTSQKLQGTALPILRNRCSQMITSNPADIPLEAPWLGKGPGLNGNGQPFGERHELYLEVSKQVLSIMEKKKELGIIEKGDYESRDFYLRRY